MNSTLFELSNFLNQLICFTLCITTILVWSQFFIKPIKNKLKKYSHICFLFTGICLTITLINRWFLSGHIPLSNLYESFNFLSWSIIFVYIFVHDWEWSLLFFAPTVLLIQIFAIFNLPSKGTSITSLVPALQSNWLIMHVSMMVISYGFLILGSILSIIWLILNNKQKNINTLEERFFLIRKNYVLIQVDYWSYRFIGLGFPLLTVGILSGAVWANEAWGSYWSWDPKETWALLTWLIFAIYLHTRLHQTWPRIQPALIATLGLGIVWICYLGVNLLGKGLHSYGWISY